MSLNVRYDAHAPAGEPDHWPTRAPLIHDLLAEHRPALLGVQEPLLHQLPWIAAGLPAHRSVGYGRSGGGRGEHSSIWYDADRFDLLDWDQQWLSDTPTLTGSVAWGADLPRIVVVAVLGDRRTGSRWTMINTHLDHQSADAQRRGAEQIAELVSSADAPVILTGDFNCAAGSSTPWQILTSAGLVDTRQVAERRDGPDVATWHGYADPVPDGERIDWILVSPEVTVRSSGIRTGGPPWPSDHFPVTAELALDPIRA